MDYTWIFFDVDGTLTVEHSIWEFLHRELGIWESQGKVNLELFLTGRMSYAEFARRDAAGYSGIHRSEFDRMLDRIQIRPGIDRCFHELHARGLRIGLISTGLDILVNRFQPVELAVANELLFENDICTGEVIVHLPIDAKAEYISGFRSKHSIECREIVSVGDSVGDIGMMLQSGLKIAVYPCDPALLDVCDFCLLEPDLNLIPDLVTTLKQGQRAFVRGSDRAR